MSKGITGNGITYNHLNLPSRIPYANGKVLSIIYDANGRKLQQTTSGGNSVGNHTKDYINGIEYRDGSLEAIYHEGGRITPKAGSGWQYEYSIRDHLGNTRLTFADLNNNGIVDVTANDATNEILQENHYTPFGLAQEYDWMSGGKGNDYRYNGMERNEELGLDLAFYRAYDPTIGRWLQVDPKAESFANLSPYNGMGNNPISIIDPLGDSLIVLSAPEQVMGLGHAAVLIGGGDRWTLYSDNGTLASSGTSGPSDKHPQKGDEYGSLEEFANDPRNQTEDGEQIYTEGYQLAADEKTDDVMREAASESVTQDYDVSENSCIDVCSDALRAGGFNPGTPKPRKVISS
ncbi:RHS repeat-associated core domain-containing protein [Neolewinella antarctica]|uniref:RHS repeat-associated protein n=1 Tax=Neolewinella antarctica TaxID=442734 RepID=A0ABX0X9S9_9BACT|nr:RHS repeat-associated core domain-containing protein [Neolewinella antarctica]NJC25714.1 RHS repeat-associated protein [Neolewinella antarctica]